MVKKLLFLFLVNGALLFSFLPWGFSETVKQKAVSCASSKDQSVIPFTLGETTKIVSATGLDQRSICSFISLGSHVYPLEVLKQTLLDDVGTMKSFLNKHVLFPEDKSFFQNLLSLLFSKKLSDSKQVLNALVLNDLLYGYTVGDTLPLYMEMFLFYGTSNVIESEKEAVDKILPYISYIEEKLLAKKDFTLENLQAYTKHVRDQMKSKIKKGDFSPVTKENEQPTQDNPY